MKGGGSNTSRIEPNGLRVCYYLILLLSFSRLILGMATSLEIPLKDGEEVIEIPFDELPEASEILQILQQVPLGSL